MSHELPKIYLITDRKQVASERDYFNTIEELLAAGVSMIQLREKDLPAADIYNYAVRLRKLTLQYEAKLLINDRLDIAEAVSADGVQLGASTLPVDIARRQLGDNATIGVSTHSLQEALSAQSKGASFVTYGPVFHTPSKAEYGAPMGTEALQIICRSVDIPVFALGGIKPRNLPQLTHSGMHGIAVISALMSAQNPSGAFRDLESILERQNLSPRH